MKQLKNHVVNCIVMHLHIMICVVVFHFPLNITRECRHRKVPTQLYVSSGTADHITCQTEHQLGGEHQECQLHPHHQWVLIVKSRISQYRVSQVSRTQTALLLCCWCVVTGDWCGHTAPPSSSIRT